MPKLTDQTRNRNPAINNILTACAPSQQGQKTSYQQNVSQPTETKWYSGSTPTVREIYTQMWKQGQNDPQGLSTAFGTFIQMQDDPSSPYFNPYRKATNKAVSTLKDMGIDTSNIDDEWFRQTSELENYLRYDGTTNAPSKPGNKASAAEKAAYERYQIGKAYDLTKQAKNEWAAMQEEIDYWATKSGRDYSDDEIIDKIYGKDNANLAKKYPTLAKMEASLQTGKDILELNDGIGYSKDNAYTAIWRSRNEGGTGDWDVDALLMATGQYNGYVEDPDIVARRTDGSAFYAPYTLGSTMDEACLYYGKPNFTTEEIASMKPDGSDATEAKIWNSLYNADQFTIKAEDELAKFNKKLDEKLEEATDPDEVMKWVNNRLGDTYKTLKELDDSTKLVNGLKDTTRAIDYSYNDVLRKVQEKCAANKIKPTPVEKVTESVGEQPQLTAQEVELSKVKDQNIRDGYEIGEGNFTSAEDTVMRNAGSSMWNFMRGMYSDAMDRLDAGRQMVQNNINDTSKTYVQDYLGNARTVANYNTVSDNYAADSEALADYQRRFGNLADYYDEFEEQKQSQLDDGTTVNMHYDPDKKGYVLDSIGMLVPEELEIYDEGSAERQLLQQAQDLVSRESARIQDIQYAHARLQHGGKEIRDEIERYGQLTARVENEKNYLQKHDEEYEKSQNILNDAETEMTIIGMASSFLGADVGGLQNARAMTDYLVDFVDQPPLPRSNETKLQSIMGIFDVTGKEATNEEVSGIIAQGKEQIQNEMKLIEDMLAYADETGIEIPANVRKNMEFKLEDYQKELEGFNYASILVDVDPAEVDKAVEAGRAFEEKYGEGNMHYWTELFQENGDFYTLKYQQRYTSPEGETYRDVVTEDDEKTYYYLLGKKVLEMGDSLDEAIGRINVDPEGTRAAVHEAFSDAKQYQQFMEDEVWAVREYDLSVAYGEQLAKDAPVLANIMATMVTPGESLASILEIIDTAVTGRRFNSKSMAGRFTGAKNAIREETRAAIDETFKDKPVAAKIANIGYEIYCNRGDSMMNALAFGWMFGGAGGMAGEFLGSVPMGTTAALSAAAEAIENGASTEQAWLIAGATFLAETVTEAVTLSNIQEAFGTGKELTKESVKDFFREWITKNGAEEAFGETLNNVIERAASRWAERMDPEGNYASDHQRLVEKYITQGKNPDEAEQLAQMDELKDDLHTAIVSYLSAGTDVFVKTGKAAINSTNYYRTATRAAQQLGDSRSMLRHMLDDHQARKNAPAGSATTTTTKGNQTVESIEADVEDVDIDFPAAAAEETADVEPAVAAEQQAQQEAETAQKTAYAKDLEVLTSAMKTGITSSATAGISAVLKMDGSDLSVDRANAAAVRAGDVFTGGIKELRGILAGGANANVDNNAVKMGIIQAILGGEESESYKIVQSEEFQNASDEQKAAMLAQTGDTDVQNESVQQAVNRIIQETRVAEVTRDAISEGMLNGAKEAQATAEQAAADARQAEEDLATRQSETQAADDARVAATEAAVQNPGDANAVKAKQAAEANMRSKVEVEQEYEQKRQKAEEKRAEAERKAKAQFDEDMATIRGQSQETVAQADQQRAEVAAQQAEAQRIVEEQQAEEDKRSGKADEEKTRALAENWSKVLNLSDPEREKFVQRVMDRQAQKTLGKIDLTKSVSNAEGYLAISAFTRKTGLKFQLKEGMAKGVRGTYENGVVSLNADMVKSGTMTVGQALVEASLHEMTHAMETAKSYIKYRNTILDFLFGAGKDRDTKALDDAVAEKKLAYQKIGENLTDKEAVQEIVADFARTRLADKEVVQRFMDAGLGGKVRNALHNVNQALKNFFGNLTGDDRREAVYLRKAERLYQRALNQIANGAVKAGDAQNSVNVAQASMTDADIDQMLAQADEDYMNAAKRGDKEAAQEAVDFAAEQAGFTDEVYHGTDFTHGFGFTKFDMNESQGEIFVAYDDVLSGTYTRTRANVREISQGVRDIWDLSDEELFELAYERLKTIENENGKVVKARVMMNGDGEFVLRTEPETYGENWSERIITRDELENELSDVYYAMQREGIYHFYANPGRQLVIDANDENWNHIQIDDAEVENDIMRYFHGNDLTEDNHFTTRQIADYARARGYDSVRINNVYDNGGRSQRRTDGMDGYGDIGIFFHPEAVKSADPITYDDNGEIIPLNQRFNRKNDDIRYSVGGEITDADIDQMLSANGLTPQLSTEQNGDLPGMPAGNGKAQRQYGHETAQGSDAIHQEVKDYLYTHSDYDPETNQEQIGRAMDWVRSNASEGDEDGYRASLDEVLSPGFDYRSADGQARMLTVMGMAALKAESGDRSALNDELRLNDAYNGQGTDIGRMLQARKIFRLMTPLGRRQALLNEVNRINTDFANRGKDTQVRLSDWTLKAAENAQSEQDFEKVQKAAEAELASQIPANWKEKLQTWRMLSMLGNPRTHIRNYVGNWIFKPAVAMKNIIATGLENRYLKDGDERTKAIRYTDDAKAFAAQDVETMRDVLTGEAKYAPENRIERQKKVFGQKNGIISRTLGQFVQGASDFNSFLLEAEDWVFLNRHYQNALASYMTANGLTSENMTGKTLEKARQYAILEAQKATYRDANEISDSLNKISRGGGVKGFLLDTVLPFKKTPANILRRGIEYSPVGLVKSLVTAKKSVDLYNSWAENGFKGTMPKGAKSMNQALDSIAAGMTGTMIAALGMLGYALGAVKLGFGKEDDDELEQERGSQEYSIELFGQSLTIDWAAPVCMPFFLGASLWQNIAENNGDITLGSVINAVMGISEPVFNLSMLDGVNSLLETAKYSTNKNSLPIGDLLQKIGANYVGSLFPALGGAWARTIDNTRRKNFIQSGDEMSIWSGMLEQAQNKIPGLSFYNIPYRNVWGEADVTPRGEAFIENFILPGYINHMKEDKLVDELQRIYDQTGDKSVIPKAAGKTVGDIKLTDKQYDQYVVTRGQTAKQLLNELIERPEFLALTPTELSPGNPEAQVQLIGEVWKYANAIARHEIDPSYDIGKNGKWIAGAYARGDVIDTIFANEEATAQTENANAAKADLVTAINGEDADAIGTSVEALKRAGKTDEQIRTSAMNDFRDIYKEAYRTGDTATMERIETGMLVMDLGEKSFTDPEEDNSSIFNKWKKDVDKESNNSGSLRNPGMMSASFGMARPSRDTGNSIMWQSMYSNTNGQLYGKGNIDLNSREVVYNDDGSISTEQSFSFYDEDSGKEVLIPTVINGRIVSEDEAINHYYETGEYLGKFDTPEEATEYAERLHERQDWYYHR